MFSGHLFVQTTKRNTIETVAAAVIGSTNVERIHDPRTHLPLSLWAWQVCNMNWLMVKEMNRCLNEIMTQIMLH